MTLSRLRKEKSVDIPQFGSLNENIHKIMPKKIKKTMIILLIIVSLSCAEIVAFIGGKCLFLGSSSPMTPIATGIEVKGLSSFSNTSSSASQTVKIVSYTSHASGIAKALPWTISGYSTDDGSTYSNTAPSWLTLSKTSGDGGVAGEDITITVAARSVKTGEIFVPSDAEDINNNSALKAMSEAGTSSSPIDLSLKDYLGNDIASSTTANCYIIHQPGWYKIPLVYGNAIKNGATNSSAFYNATASTAFEDSWGNAFTSSSSPYIYTHARSADKSLGSAEVLWCDTACGIDSVSLGGSGTSSYIKFHIPAFTIEEGNFLLAIKDNNGNIAWSWHIWVTGRDLSPVTIKNHDGATFDIMPVNLGWNGWGTEGTIYSYASQNCIVRFKHIGSEYTRDVTVSCPAKASMTAGSIVRGSSPYYQWGRKDPFICFGASTTGSNIEYSESAGSQAQAHKNPKIHYMDWDYCSWTTDMFPYFWDTDNTGYSVDSPVMKTIYDPCPAGWNIPQYNTFTGFAGTGYEGYYGDSEFPINNIGGFNKG